MNDFDVLAEAYALTDEAPAKRFSMTATADDIVRPIRGRIVLDVGCGSGFFTRNFAQRARQVYGVDVSREQIRLASQRPKANITYVSGDVRTMGLPNVDIAFVPFVLNYQPSVEDISSIITKLHGITGPNGLVAGILDMPRDKVHDCRNYGSIIRTPELEDAKPMTVELYRGGKSSEETTPIVTLNSFYYSERTIADQFGKAGFADFKWETPKASLEGVQIFGDQFWFDYFANCDVAYFTARKA